MTRNIYILAPRDIATGGIELLHQLGHALNSDGTRAWMIYHPFGPAGTVPNVYKRYNVSPVARRDVRPGSIIVIPEIYTKLANEFPLLEIFYWWLSVDNFLKHAKITPLGRMLGARTASKLRLLPKLRKTGGTHLYQSEYARLFIESAKLSPSLRLSDYIADDYIQSEQSLDPAIRENIIIYNPTKGLERSRLIIRELLSSNTDEKPRIIALQNMTREEICRLLGRAKVYIDFGGHPGKDRIPREAAAMGVCILVNRRGSAANQIDIPILDDFKIDDRLPGYEKLAARKILDIMQNFEQNHKLFDDYRMKIAEERDVFTADVASIFAGEA